MTKSTLFVCQSCHHSSEERPEDQPADGTRLLEQLNALCAEQIQGMGKGAFDAISWRIVLQPATLVNAPDQLRAIAN